MNNTRRELAIRKDEAMSLLLFVSYLENDFKPIENSVFNLMIVTTSVKANIVMMLYNAVESTVGQCLEKIHEKINTKNLKYNDLSNELKKLIAVYYGHSIDKTNNVDNAMEYVLRFADFINGNVYVTISYEELTKKYQLYSGNLDSREIMSVLKKYGIVFEKKCSELKTIKDYRNKLAHGEESFEEVGRTLTFKYLEEMEQRTFEYLEEMISVISDYLAQEKYRK